MIIFGVTRIFAIFFVSGFGSLLESALEIRFGIGFGRAFGIERVFDGQHAGEDRSVAMNIFDLAGVDLLIPVEGAAADGFDFALGKPHVALLRP